MKPMEGNIEENYDFGLDNVLNMTSKAQIKGKTDKLDFIKRHYQENEKTTHKQNRTKYLQIIHLIRMLYLDI